MYLIDLNYKQSIKTRFYYTIQESTHTHKTNQLKLQKIKQRLDFITLITNKDKLIDPNYNR